MNERAVGGMFLGNAGFNPQDTRCFVDPCRLYRRDVLKRHLPLPALMQGIEVILIPTRSTWKLLEFFFQIHDPKHIKPTGQ